MENNLIVQLGGILLTLVVTLVGIFKGLIPKLLDSFEKRLSDKDSMLTQQNSALDDVCKERRELTDNFLKSLNDVVIQNSTSMTSLSNAIKTSRRRWPTTTPSSTRTTTRFSNCSGTRRNRSREEKQSPRLRLKSRTLSTPFSTGQMPVHLIISKTGGNIHVQHQRGNNPIDRGARAPDGIPFRDILQDRSDPARGTGTLPELGSRSSARR